MSRQAIVTGARSGRGRLVAIASAHGLAASPFKAGSVSPKHRVLGPRGGAFTGAPLIMDAGWTAR